MVASSKKQTNNNNNNKQTNKQITLFFFPDVNRAFFHSMLLQFCKHYKLSSHLWFGLAVSCSLILDLLFYPIPAISKQIVRVPIS